MDGPCWEGYEMIGWKRVGGKRVPNCVPKDNKEVMPCCPEEPIEKAEEGYKPTAGMKTAAARAIRWKEEGKATGAGTPVGWTRARQIVNNESLSLDTVKRMYSFFSRHEVDKKGKDFYNLSNPSNGRIMWDAWGGDAGFTWSRAIVQRKAKTEKLWDNSVFDLRKGV